MLQWRTLALLLPSLNLLVEEEEEEEEEEDVVVDGGGGGGGGGGGCVGGGENGGSVAMCYLRLPSEMVHRPPVDYFL